MTVLTCKICGIDYEVKKYRAKTSNFCSHKCYWASLIGIKRIHSPEHCKNISLNKIGKKRLDIPWNKGRKFPEFSGENHPNWQGGITPINKKIRNSLEYKLWRTAVFERDDYTCVWCGERGCELNADHIKPFCDYPELRFAIDNGRTLCVDCHKKTETFAGRGGKRKYYKNKLTKKI